MEGIDVHQLIILCIFLHGIIMLYYRVRERKVWERGEDMQQRTTGRIRTRVAALRTGPIWYALHPELSIA